MVHLSKIYTRSGDDGSTGLGDGSRRPKHDLRVATYGTVDETNSTIGIAVAQLDPETHQFAALGEILRQVQNDLFDVGADLCVPGEAGERLRIEPAYTTRLERWIDEHNARLEPLNSFILPGGHPVAAWLHQARTVCRRAERRACRLAALDGEEVNPEVVCYLNRCSDLLFVLARVANGDGEEDILWRPGGSGKDAGSEA